MTVYAITDTKKGRTGIAPTYLQTTLILHCLFVRAHIRDFRFAIRTACGYVTRSDVYTPSSHIQIEFLCGHVYLCCEHGCENMDDENADAVTNVSSPLDIGLYIIVCSTKNVNVGYLNGERVLGIMREVTPSYR